MANVRAIKNGNWSDTTVWNTGALPTSADDVFANTFTVTVDGTYTVLSIRNTSGTSITAGGQFVLANGANLTCTAAQSIWQGTSGTAVLLFSLDSPNAATFSGGMTTLPTSSAGLEISHTGTGNFTVNGNWTLSGGDVNAAKTCISITGAGTLSFNGIPSVQKTQNASNIARVISATNASATVNIVGSFAGTTVATNSNASHPVYAQGTTNITGNIQAAMVQAGGTLNLTGNYTGGASAAAIIDSAVATTFDLVGIGTSGTGANAIACTSGNSIVRLYANVINVGVITAIYAARIVVQNTNMFFRYRDASNTLDRTFYAAGVSLGNPATSNVAAGVTYGPSGELTGTFANPGAANTRKGVPVGATVGTAELTAEDMWSYATRTLTEGGGGGATASQIWGELLSAITTPNSIGKLLKDNVDAAITSRLSSAGYTAPANIDIAAIKAKTDNLPSDPADQSAVESAISGAQSAIISALPAAPDNAGIAAIKAKTDNLPAAPAATADIPSADTNAGGVRTELATELARIDAAITTRLAAASYTAPDSAATIATAVWSAVTRTLTSNAAPSAEDVAAAVWSAVTRTLTTSAGGATAQQVWEYATRSLTEALDVPTAEEISAQVWTDQPERLTNVATVQSTGDQIAALNEIL